MISRILNLLRLATFLFAVMASAWLNSAQGATWPVTCDPEHPEDRVGTAVRQASTGDTILVGPGTYYEHIAITDKELVFLSTDGPVATVLDGSRSLPGTQGAIVYTENAPGSLSLTLRGFTLRQGSGAASWNGHPAGGALCWWTSNPGGTTAVTITDCIFQDNSIPDDFATGGGAVYVTSADQVRISGCTFLDNICWGGAGSNIYVSGWQARCDVESCTMTSHFGVTGFGEFIFADDDMSLLTVDACRFDGHAQYDASYGINSYSDATRILDSEFKDDGLSLASNIYIHTNTGPVEVRGNLVCGVALSDPHPADFGVSVMGGHSVQVCENTIVRAPVNAVIYGESSFCRNIVYHSPQCYLVGNSGHALCNDAWPDTITTSPNSTIEFQDNISLDPLFCSESAGDFRLDAASPCLPDNSPEGCGLIGARDIGCQGGTRVETSTWGRLKAIYRGTGGGGR